MEATRDLACPDVWAKSLEQSLARRGKPRRASVELYRLKPERDLASPQTLRESSAYWQIRRTALERAEMPITSAGTGAALALLAAATAPSLVGHGGRTSALHAQTAKPTHGRSGLTAAIDRALAMTRHRHELPAAATAKSAPAARGQVRAGTQLTGATTGELGASTRPTATGTGATAGPTATHGTAAPPTAAPPTPTTASHTVAAHTAAPPTASHTVAAHTAAVHTAAAPATASHAAAAHATVAPTASHATASHAAAAQHAGPTHTAAPVTGAVLTGSVIRAQHLLGVTADGIVGPQTATAIRSYQAAHRLTVDGVVGPKTWAALTGAQAQAAPATGASAHATTAAQAHATSPAAASPAYATTTAASSASATPAASPAHAAPAATSAHTARSAHHAPAAAPSGGSAVPGASVASAPVTHAKASVDPATTQGSAKAGTGTHAAAATPLVHGRPTSAANLTAGPVGPAAGTPAKPKPKPATNPAANLTGVKALQARLGVSVDGDFGPATEAAVERFQRAHGLTPNGIVGATTRAALGLGPGPTLKEPGSTATTDPTTGDPTTITGGTPSTGISPTGTSPTGSAAAEIADMIAAGNEIATRPYVYGGGHGSFISNGYDCSGSVSYVLHAAGLLSSPEDSTELESYGAAGPGKYVTIYANAGHAWMTIDGRRFDTIALAETGTRWSSTPGSTAGYVVRHPVGL